ncbi:MAG: divalent metal cation transporter [Pseudomonadota bacterium]
MKQRSLLVVLGPGMLYAAAAVGVSHLVQATRAGADYGLALVTIIFLACILKYPAIRFGVDYASITRRSLVSNYRSQGLGVFVLYALSQVFSMVFVIAAVSLLTAGLIQASLGIDVQPLVGVVALLAGTVALLAFGNYKWLERVTKFIVGAFTVLIVAAVTLVAGDLSWANSNVVPPQFDIPTWFFIIALIGFMPTPADGSVLQSLWTVAKQEQDKETMHIDDARLDFNVGYIGSVLLAVGFIVLGAVLMHQPGIEVARGNVGFANQLFGLFTQSIGAWSFALIALAAVFVMSSTLLAVFDGMARVVLAIRGEIVSNTTARGDQYFYRFVLFILGGLAVLVLATLMQSFAAFMDMTSVIVFLISPLVAYLNHRAMFGTDIPLDQQPGKVMRVWSLVGVFSLLLLAVGYLYMRWLQ